MAKEFLTKVIEDIGKTMFPNGSPISSTYHIQNGNFKACGQIAAVSLAQGGPPVNFLEECVYSILVDPNTTNDIQFIDYEKHLTAYERKLLEQIKENPQL